jgi:N4-gp56 family major capsid protein
MSLATDTLVQKAITSTTNMSAIIPKIWAAQLEKNLRIGAILQQSIVENTDLLVPDSGDTVYIPTLPDLGTTGGNPPTTVGALTEGTDIVDIVMDNATSVAFVPTEYGMGVGVTRKMLDRIKYDGVAAVVDRLGYAMSRTIETQIAALYNKDVPGTANAMDVEYVATDDTGVTKATSATITAADTFNDELLLRGVQRLQEKNNVPFPDGFFMCFISPAQAKALMLDQNIRQDLRFGAPEKLFRGEIGALHNCRIIVTNSIATDTENSVSVFNSLLVAPRWAAVAWKRRPQVVIDPTLYDYGRRRRFGVFADFDIEMLHADRGIVLKSA